jgi:hypothetical protein
MTDLTGTVITKPTYFFGTHTHCEHEQFGIQTRAGVVQVIDNVGIAPRVPVQPGDSVEVRGDMVRDPGKPSPIIHWTHHDPGHHHPDGFIRLNGKLYA